MAPKINPLPRRFAAMQMVLDLYSKDQAMLKIETKERPVVVHMHRSVLEQFFQQANGLQLRSQQPNQG